jgi:TolB protein
MLGTADRTAVLDPLLELMRATFNLQELRELCFRLAVDYEELGEGLGKSDRILALIYDSVHHGRQEQLLETLKMLRPHVSWPAKLDLRHPLPNVPGRISSGQTGFSLNTTYGAIAGHHPPPQVRLREVSPRPPRPPRGFIGRSAHLAELSVFISANEVVAVYGPDGMGKTALAKQAANALITQQMPNGVLFLEGVDEKGEALPVGDLIQHLFDALFASEPPLAVTVTSARTYLSHTRPLLLLDNLSLPTLLTTLADLFPESPILVTGVHRPRADNALPLRLEPLPESDAVRLLAARAGLDPAEGGDRPHLAALAALLGGVPQALITAGDAMRENKLSPAEAHRILDLLPAEANDPAQAALERAYYLAYAPLSPEERGLLARVAALPGISVSTAWLEEVAGDPAAVARLQALGLLQANSPRLRLPPALRTLARQRLRREQSHEQLLAYVHRAMTTGTFGFDFCAAELGNLLGLITWAAGRGRWADVVELGRAVDPFLALRGLWASWQTVLEQVLAAAENAGDREAEGWALHQLGSRAIGTNDSVLAATHLRRALVVRQALGDTIGAAYTQHNLDFLLPPGSPSSPQQPLEPRSGRGPLLPHALLLSLIGAVAVGLVGTAMMAGWLLSLWRAGVPTGEAQPETAVVQLATATATATTARSTPPPSLTLPAKTPAPEAPVTALPATVPPAGTPTPPLWQIPFVSDREDDSYQIYLLQVAEAAGNLVVAGVERLTHEEGFYYDPVLAPDGQRVAFITGGWREHEIIVLPLNSRTAYRLTQQPENDDMHPVWSPDGSRLAFVSNRDGESAVYVSGADGREQLPLAARLKGSADPAWSPDGRQLAFTVPAAEGRALYLANADGTGLVNLTNAGRITFAEPTWSPDGQRLAFIVEAGSGSEVYIMNVDGSEITPLLPDQQGVAGRGAWLSGLRWSPDGRRLALLRWSQESVNYYIVAVDGSHLERFFGYTFTPSCTPAESMIWSPDGRWLAFSAAGEIYAVNAQGDVLINLTNHPAYDFFILAGGC